MKRSPLKRKTRLKVRGRSRFPRRRDERFLQYVREQECLVQGYMAIFENGIGRRHSCGFFPGRPAVEPAHLKTRGSGGYDLGNAVPLCPVAHDQQEGQTAEFEWRYGVNLEREAQKIAERYLSLALSCHS